MRFIYLLSAIFVAVVMAAPGPTANDNVLTPNGLLITRQDVRIRLRTTHPNA